MSALIARARLTLWQDLLVTESLRKNWAVVIDSAIAIAEGTSSRPSTMVNNRVDALEELSEFHDIAPAQLKHLTISVEALDGGKGRVLKGGYAARATMTLSLVTNKGQRQKDYKFNHAITPNAHVMVRSAPIRLLRQLMLRGALLGCHQRRPKAVGERVAAADFAGLAPCDAGYDNEYEMARACEELHWAIWVEALEWALIPHVCKETGAIKQCTSYQARMLASAVAELGHDLGYPPGLWGWWSIRKKVCDDIVSAGDDEIAGRELGHANVNNRTKNRVYKKGQQNRDMGAYALGAERLTLADVTSLSSRRVPGSRVRDMESVRRDGAAYAKYYVGDEKLSATRALVEALEDEVGEALGMRTRPLKLTKQRMTLLDVQHPEVHQSAVELKKERVTLLGYETTAVHATKQVERQHVWKEGQALLMSDERERLAMQSVQDWPEMREAHAVAFSLARPDLSVERKLLMREEPALREAVLNAGAVHLLSNERWRHAFVAVCSACEQEAPLVRPLRCDTAGCTGGAWSYSASRADLDHIASEAGKCVWRDLYGVWRALGGDEHIGGPY